MADGEENMSVQGDGLEEYRVPDEDMPAVSSSSSGRSRIVADYERRYQQLKPEHDNELRLRDLQEAKRIDMIQKKAKQELEDSEYVREMEAKKTSVLAAMKEAEKLNSIELQKIKISDLRVQKIRSQRKTNLNHHNQRPNQTLLYPRHQVV